MGIWGRRAGALPLFRERARGKRKKRQCFSPKLAVLFCPRPCAVAAVAGRGGALLRFFCMECAALGRKMRKFAGRNASVSSEKNR